MIEETLLNSGKIYMVKSPIKGNAGINMLDSLVVSGALGISMTDKQEKYVIFFNKSRNRCRILHIDEAGVTLMVRRLFSKKFQVILDSSDNQVLTREQLKRLLLDGTVDGDWQSEFRRFCAQQTPVPQAKVF